MSCPVRGCTDDEAFEAPCMCRRHWNMLPRHIQTAVAKAWYRYHKALNGNRFANREIARRKWENLRATAVEFLLNLNGESK